MMVTSHNTEQGHCEMWSYAKQNHTPAVEVHLANLKLLSQKPE